MLKFYAALLHDSVFNGNFSLNLGASRRNLINHEASLCCLRRACTMNQ